MATKNLARTVIEGGRSRSSGWMRRYANRSERAGVRHGLRVLARDAERDDIVLGHKHTGGFRWFRDKLGPATRWLASNVGRPWGLVRSELFQRFDIRTTAGRHILFDHILSDVNENGRPVTGGLFCRWDFWVDRHGILRRVKDPRVKRT